MWQIIKSVSILTFTLLLAFQGWRSFCFNSVNIVKSVFQIINLKRSEHLLAEQNRQLILKIESLDIQR